MQAEQNGRSCSVSAAELLLVDAYRRMFMVSLQHFYLEQFNIHATPMSSFPSPYRHQRTHLVRRTSLSCAQSLVWTPLSPSPTPTPLRSITQMVIHFRSPIPFLTRDPVENLQAPSKRCFSSRVALKTRYRATARRYCRIGLQVPVG